MMQQTIVYCTMMQQITYCPIMQQTIMMQQITYCKTMQQITLLYNDGTYYILLYNDARDYILYNDATDYTHILYKDHHTAQWTRIQKCIAVLWPLRWQIYMSCGSQWTNPPCHDLCTSVHCCHLYPNEHLRQSITNKQQQTLQHTNTPQWPHAGSTAKAWRTKTTESKIKQTALIELHSYSRLFMCSSTGM